MRPTLKRGFLFLCNNKTESECFRRKLFGSPRSQLFVMRSSIRSGANLFLFNTQSSNLFGPFEATAGAALNLEPGAWGGRFPAQVQFKWRRAGPSRTRKALSHRFKLRAGKIDEQGMRQICQRLQSGVRFGAPACGRAASCRDSVPRQSACSSGGALVSRSSSSPEGSGWAGGAGGAVSFAQVVAGRKQKIEAEAKAHVRAEKAEVASAVAKVEALVRAEKAVAKVEAHVRAEKVQALVLAATLPPRVPSTRPPLADQIKGGTSEPHNRGGTWDVEDGRNGNGTGNLNGNGGAQAAASKRSWSFHC